MIDPKLLRTDPDAVRRSQAARGEGALAGKFRHPAVAPHLRAVQRQFPQIERLL